MTIHTRCLAWSAGLLAALPVGACGSGSASTTSGAAQRQGSPGATGAARPKAPGKPPTVPGTTAPPGSPAGASATTPSEPIRVPVVLTFTRPGHVDPPAVTIPTFVPIELTLISRDGGAHAVALRSGGRTYTVRVRAGAQATTHLPGLRGGRYRLAPVGGGPGATLIVGGRVGP